MDGVARLPCPYCGGKIRATVRTMLHDVTKRPPGLVFRMDPDDLAEHATCKPQPPTGGGERWTA